MKCSFCGAEIAEGSTKCPVCGIPVDSACSFSSRRTDAPSPISGGQVRCTACGATLPAGTQFCPQCGNRLAGPTEEAKMRMQQQQDDFWNGIEAEAQAQEKRRRKDAWISWALRLAGLAGAAFLIYYITT